IPQRRASSASSGPHGSGPRIRFSGFGTSPSMGGTRIWNATCLLRGGPCAVRREGTAMRSPLIFPRITRHPRVSHSRVAAPAHPDRAVSDRPVGVSAPPSDSLVEYAAYIEGEKVTAPSIVEALSLVRAHNRARQDGPAAFVWV